MGLLDFFKDKFSLGEKRMAYQESPDRDKDPEIVSVTEETTMVDGHVTFEVGSGIYSANKELIKTKVDDLDRGQWDNMMKRADKAKYLKDEGYFDKGSTWANQFIANDWPGLKGVLGLLSEISNTYDEVATAGAVLRTEGENAPNTEGSTRLERMAAKYKFDGKWGLWHFLVAIEDVFAHNSALEAQKSEVETRKKTEEAMDEAQDATAAAMAEADVVQTERGVEIEEEKAADAAQERLEALTPDEVINLGDSDFAEYVRDVSVERLHAVYTALINNRRKEVQKLIEMTEGGALEELNDMLSKLDRMEHEAGLLKSNVEDLMLLGAMKQMLDNLMKEDRSEQDEEDYNDIEFAYHSHKKDMNLPYDEEILARAHAESFEEFDEMN